MFEWVWNSKPFVAVRTVSDVYGIVAMLAAIGGSAIVPAAILGTIAFLGNASWPLVGLIGVVGYALALAAILFLLPRMPTVKKQVKDKELKQRCCESSEELFAFVEERALNDPQEEFESALMDPSVQDASGQLQNASRYTQETEAQYKKRFEREVERLLDASERRGWSSAEERKRLEPRWWGLEPPENWMRRTAQHLENVCRNA